jgi:hypothetical protein
LLKNEKFMVVQTIYDDVADFIANMNPTKILELKAPKESQDRLWALIEKEKESSLSPLEKDELDHFLVLERLIRLAKAHARQRLAVL